MMNRGGVGVVLIPFTCLDAQGVPRLPYLCILGGIQAVQAVHFAGGGRVQRLHTPQQLQIVQECHNLESKVSLDILQLEGENHAF